jgi:protein-S-isoprenylcysteine O-methyltransferase Ste14
VDNGKQKRATLVKLVLGAAFNVALYAVALLVPAGTWKWWRAWVIVAVAFVGTVGPIVSLWRGKSGVLEERLKPPMQKGQPFADKIVVSVLVVSYIAVLAFVPVDVFRLHVMRKPGMIISSLGLLLFIVGWWIAYLAMRENAFASAAVRHQEERKHRVIDTGVYGVVRHPMYAGSVLLVFGLPLWLESYAGALLGCIPIAAVIVRVLFEEGFLRRELLGYGAYSQRVRYRIIPHVW